MCLNDIFLLRIHTYSTGESIASDLKEVEMSHQLTNSSSVAQLQPVTPSASLGRAAREMARRRQSTGDLTLIFHPCCQLPSGCFQSRAGRFYLFCFSLAQMGYLQWAILTGMRSDSCGYKVETDPRSRAWPLKFHSSLEPNQLSFTPIDPRPLITPPI